MRIALAASLFALGGCATVQPLKPSKSLDVVSTGDMPAPQRADMTVNSRPYLIGPFDKLSINVFGVEDLTGKVQADASGRISIPLIGVVEAAGKTPAELSEEIAGRLQRYVKNPQVSVNLDETVSQVITVDGEVKKPGLYPVVGHMTLMRAVATAEGASDLAKLDDVVLFRTVGGKKYAGLYNLKAIRRGTYDDPEIYPNDVIIVGESGTRRIFRDALAVSPAILTPLIYLIR